ERAMSDSDVFVTFANAIENLPDLKALAGKIVIIDFLTESTEKKLEAAQPSQIIEFAPDHPKIQALQFRHFSVLAALIDLLRLSEKKPMEFDAYLLRWIQELDIRPRRLRSARGIVRKCAFIIHPLSSKQLWKGVGMPGLMHAPDSVKKWAEYGVAR